MHVKIQHIDGGLGLYIPMQKLGMVVDSRHYLHGTSNSSISSSRLYITTAERQQT